MALPVIAGTVRATFRGTNAAGQQWANVMHFRYADGASSPGIVEVTALDTKVLRLYTGTAYSGGAAYLTLCTPDIKLLDAVYYVLNGTAPPMAFTHTQAGTGTAATNTAQEQAMVVTLRTDQRGRRNRGRIYLPSPTTGAMTGATGQLAAANVTLVVKQCEGLQADLANIQWEWGVASYGHGTDHGVPTTWTPYFSKITQFTMDGIPDVQRRRKQ